MPADAPAGREVHVSFEIPEDSVPQYATNFLFRGTSAEHFIAFFVARLPLELDQKKLSAIGEMPSTFLAEFVMSPPRLIEFHRVLSEHLKKHGYI